MDIAHHPWIFTFGILGNIISVVIFLAHLPTFFRIYRKKSTERFQSIPYVVALFSAMLWIYYATLKSSDYLLLTINSVGCLVETIYIVILTLKLALVMNFGGFSAILLLTHFFAKGSSRLHIVGWFSVALSTVVFVAPLGIMDGRKVIEEQNLSEIIEGTVVTLSPNKTTFEVHAGSLPTCDESEVGDKQENSDDHDHQRKPNGDFIESLSQVQLSETSV
ncbi:hypothetical protein GH714_040544 [Hevea brasiliensis]|uniref:Bidirectional sugar transporter SWEET n=1 Tax=Hevea brasiliensis TaxID=3981 RepID=A0A6A6MIR2_HEVBR|nr:hypothetical protein GH714_040544 [Hevea brasiliensis]